MALPRGKARLVRVRGGRVQFGHIYRHHQQFNWWSLFRYSLTHRHSIIKLLESPIPAAAAPSQKASSDDISGTKRGTIDPLVSKRPEKILNKKIQN